MLQRYWWRPRARKVLTSYFIDINHIIGGGIYMSEFRKADNSVYQVFLEIIEEYFPALSSFSFGLLFREKLKKSRGGVILAEVCLPSKLLSYYAKNEEGNPYDFLVIFDEMAWACGKIPDRVKIMRHEMRHIFISEKGKPMMVGHDFEDFHAEVELNIDDPSWGSNLAEVIVAAYKQIKEGGKDPRLDRRDAPGATVTHKDEQRQTFLDLTDGKGSGDNNITVDEVLGEEETEAKSPGGTSGAGDKTAKGTNGATLMEGKKAELKDSGPVKDASAKLDALSKKRGLRVPASASQI
jgi:hypothetical protein